MGILSSADDRAIIASAIDGLRRACGGSLPPILDDALILARGGHAGQRRRSGEPYLIHPIHVATLLAESGWDLTTIAAGLCHDLLEDTAVRPAEIEHAIGPEGYSLVSGVTRMDHIRTHEAAGEAADIQRLLGAVAGDVRVLAVKLADRLHNIRTLEHLDHERQVRISRQTLELIAPLAHRVGALAWARELEDTCFQYAYPTEALTLEAALLSGAAGRIELERDAVTTIAAALALHGVEARVESRTKGRWSLWTKLQRVGSLDQVWDQVGIRVITADPAGCYAALGVVHATFVPVPGRFKDYIALPKANQYRALHTVVVDEFGRHFEVQLRDETMDLEARYGSAAHYRYKQGVPRPGLQLATDLTGLGPEQFLEELRAELANTEQIMVLTPRGDVISLPKGSCAIDFAYAVHTEIGHCTVGAKVNGRLRPIRRPLETGDTVEILTRTTPQPSRDWLDSVASAGARAKIRRHFSQQDRAEHERTGRIQVDRALVAAGLESVGEGMLIRAGVGEPSELYRLIGSGRLDVARVLPQPQPLPRRLITRSLRRRPSSDALMPDEPLSALSGLRSQPAGCCSPKERDSLVGYVSIGRGLILHRADCLNLVALRSSLSPADQGRIIPLPGTSDTVVVRATDREGLLAEIAAEFARLGIRIAGSRTGSAGGAVELRLGVTDLDPELEAVLLEGLARVPSVLAIVVERATI